MLERMLIAGTGGQGVILLGKLVATAALERFSNVTFFPAYGAEVRGGTSNCQALFSDTEIASPVAERFDSMLIMNQASLDRFRPQAAPGALVLVNTSLCSDEDASAGTGIPATDLAVGLGNRRAANFVMLGAYLALKPLLSLDGIRQGMRRMLHGKAPAMVDINMAALQAGREAVAAAAAAANTAGEA
jgi:2-oxoglutarate ferredoxin oxidoreductase subunit gamma